MKRFSSLILWGLLGAAGLVRAAPVEAEGDVLGAGLNDGKPSIVASGRSGYGYYHNCYRCRRFYRCRCRYRYYRYHDDCY